MQRILTLTLCLLASSNATAQTFITFGSGTRATGVAPDGKWVTGTSSGGTFLWNAQTGFNLIVGSSSDSDPKVANGGVYVSGTFGDATTGLNTAARWDNTGMLTFLPGLAGQSGLSLSTAYGMSDDGNVVVGLGWVNAGTAHGFKWTPSGGTVDLGSALFGSSRANGVSGNGSIVVGWDGNPRRAAIWNAAGETVIGTPGFSSEAWAASFDGSVVTGFQNNQLMKWTQPSGVVLLGKLPGSVSSDIASGLDISADGGTIVGTNGSVLGTGFRALLWRQDLGLVDLKPYLEANGFASQLNGWSLLQAYGISGDGRFVCGVGRNPGNQLEGFFLQLPGLDPLVYSCDPGVGGTLACPCSNPASSADRGCDNSAATGGARLTSTGTANLLNDTMVLITQDQRPTGTTIILQGTSENLGGTVFGQGIRCAAGTLKRLYVKTASAGSVTAPLFTDPTISQRSAALGDPIFVGTSRSYLAYYRDPVVLGGCPSSSTFNATNTGTVTWQ
jgi:probable HAF family extracellular repeat protein